MGKRAFWAKFAFIGVLCLSTAALVGGCGEREAEQLTGGGEAVQWSEKEASAEVRGHLVMRTLLAGAFSPVDARYENALCQQIEDEIVVQEKKKEESATQDQTQPPPTKERNLILVRSAGKERALADALFENGYFPESAYHYKNVLTYLLPEGDPSRGEIESRLSLCARYLPDTLFSHDSLIRPRPTVPTERPQQPQQPAQTPEGSRKEEEKEAPKKLALFFRVGNWYLLSVNTEALEITQEMLPLYFQAQEFEKNDQTDKAIEKYTEILKRVEKNRIAALDLHAKLALLYNRRCDGKALEHYLKVLNNLHLLPLEIECRNVPAHRVVRMTSRETILASPRITEERPIIIPGEEEPRDVILSREIERIQSAHEQKPVPLISGLTYLRAVEQRRKTFIDSARAFLPEPDPHNLDLMSRIADCYILNGYFAKAQHILTQVSSVSAGAETDFKVLACSVQEVLRAVGSGKGDLAKLEQAVSDVSAYQTKYRESEFCREAQYLKARLHLQLGRKKEARDIFATLAAEKDFEFAADAQLALSVIERKLLRVKVPQALTTGTELPVELTLRNIEEVNFSFSRVTEEIPVVSGAPKSAEEQIREFFNSHKESELQFAGNVSATFPAKEFGERQTVNYSLPIPEPGVFIVEASGGGISCRFVAIRNDVKATAAALPKSTIIHLQNAEGKPVSGASLYGGSTLMGTTDKDGIILCPSTAALFSPTCDQCGKHWTECPAYQGRCRQKYGTANPFVLREVTCAGPGCIFRLNADVQNVKIEKLDVPPIAPQLYVYADRPVYQAGDTVRFRGILRVEKERVEQFAQSRFQSLSDEVVGVEVKDKDSTLFTRQFTTGEFGTFHGEYSIPHSAARKKYSLVVTYGQSKQTAEFEVRDYVKPDYIIKMIPEKNGFRIFAGYSWGAPIPGTRIQFQVGDKQGEKSLDEKGEAFIPAKDGQVVIVVLRKGDEELVQKDETFYAPKALPEQPEEIVAKGTETEQAEPSEKIDQPREPEEAKQPEEKPLFTVTKDKEIYRAGDTIRLTLTCRKYPKWEALVVLGDYSGYDCKFVKADTETAEVEFAVCGSYDPGTFAFVRFTDGTDSNVETVSIPVRACLLNVKIQPEKAQCDPGEEAQVTLTALNTGGKPVRAEASLAAVDEAIFAMGEDKTPDIYNFFYKERKGACSFYDYNPPSFPGEEVVAESEPDLTNWRYFNVSIAAYRLESTSAVDAYGLGGGKAGAYGVRWGSGGIDAYGGLAGSEGSVVSNLGWLHSHQDSDGKWDCDNFMKNCKDTACSSAGLPEYDVMVTSLTKLSFLGNGHTHRVGMFKNTVKKALDWLVSEQQSDGSIGKNSGRFWVLNHATATAALCEAYAITRDSRLQSPAQRALDFLISAKTPASGWGFGVRDGNPNSLATGWAVLALKAAKTAKLAVPDEAFADVLKFFDSVTDLRGWTYFEKVGDADPDFLGNASQFDTLPEWTAVSALCRIFCGQSRRHSKILRSVDILTQNLPAWDRPNHRKVNMHYWYWGTSTLFQYGGEKWHRWNEAMKRALLDSQRVGGCADGSWDPVGRWGALYGRVGATATVALTLEIYYRYARAGGGVPFEEPEPEIRLYFPDTAFWAHDLVTDENGRVVAKFKLPDEITSVRLTARAVTPDTAVGEAVNWIEIKKDFFVKLKTPQFFVTGDTASIYAEIYNYTDSPQQVRLKLEGEGFQLLSSKEVTVEVQNDGMPNRAYWAVKIISGKAATFTVIAHAGGFTDAMQLTIPVKVLGKEFVETATAALKREEKLAITLPREAQKETASLEVVLRPTKSNLYYILDTLRYLTEYPHG